MGCTMTVHAPLIAALRQALADHADAGRAGPMQAYMKSAMPFLGIPAPLRRALTQAAVRAHPAPDAPALAGSMAALWREARWREERYVAIELPRTGRQHRRLADRLGLDLLPLVEEMIVDGAWWDLVDDLSGNLVAGLLRAHPTGMKPRLRAWARGDDLWLRRAAMLCQRGLREATDAALLYDCLRPSLTDARFAGEFFIRKGMGWALRERAYTAPDEVRAFCDSQPALSALTRREALRALRTR